MTFDLKFVDVFIVAIEISGSEFITPTIVVVGGFERGFMDLIASVSDIFENEFVIPTDLTEKGIENKEFLDLFA